MNRMIKKSTALILSVLYFVFTFTAVANAANDERFSVNKKIVINEWDEYKRITSMTDEELSDSGYSPTEIAEIRNFDYETEIRKRAALDDQTLERYGYTAADIQKLRQVAAMDKIPENELKAISTATMTSSLRYVSNGSRIEGGSTMYYVNYKFSWSWNRIPFIRYIDMVAIAFSSSTGSKFTYCAQGSNKVYANLTAIQPSYTTRSQIVNWVYSTSKPNTISAKFATSSEDSNGNITHFAYSGYGTFQLTNRSNNARLYLDACYGHATILVVPSYSISTSGISVGVEFNLGTDDQHCTGYFYENFTIARNYIYHGTVYGKNGTGGTAA